MEYTSKLSIAVLVCCYNRKQKTLAFLESLVGSGYFKKLDIDIYLLDDNSTDDTGAAVSEQYPFVHIVKGTGSLFWAGGMRTIWRHAISKKDYDLFLIFNDDVILFNNAIENLITNYWQLNKEGVILIGSTLSKQSNKLTYGGNVLKSIKHNKYYVVIPDNTELLTCHIANANVLLVDKYTVEKIGIFPDDYIHCLADFDYTLTAFKSGINVLVAPGYYGYCEDDHGVNWLSRNHSLKERIEYLYSPKGLAYKEYLFYIRKHFPNHYLTAFVKLWIKTLFPTIWDKFKLRGGH